MTINIVLVLLFLYVFLKDYNRGIILATLWHPVLRNFIVFEGVNVMYIVGIISVVFLLIKKNDYNFRDYPFLPAFIIYGISVVLSHINNVNNAGLSIVYNIISEVYFPFMCFFAVKHIEAPWKFIYRNFLVFGFVISIVGLVEMIFNFNLVAAFLTDRGLLSLWEVGEGALRFGSRRCQSLTCWWETYGVNCSYTLLTVLMLDHLKCVKRRMTVLLFFVIMLCFGVFSTGSRTVYITFIIAMLTYMFYVMKNFKGIVGVLLFVLIIYNSFASSFDEIFTSFANHETYGGSSIEMRLTQLNIAWSEFLKNPIFGTGVGGAIRLTEMNSDFYGAESMLYLVLIDRGLFGLFASIALLISTIRYLIKKELMSFIPIVLGVIIGKILSYYPDIFETYHFMFLFIIIRAYYEHTNTVLEKKYTI